MVVLAFRNLPFAFLLLFVAVSPVVSPAVSVAQESAAVVESFKVAIVDIQRVLIHSEVGKKTRESFEKDFKKKQKILDEKSRQYEKMEEDITKNLSIMNEETLKRKSEDLEKKKKELVRAKEDFSDELRGKQEEMRAKLFTQIEEVVNEFGESEGYSMILARDSAGVIFASEGVDVTEKIIDLYDRKY